MMRLCKFELKKIWQSHFFIVALLSLALLNLFLIWTSTNKGSAFTSHAYHTMNTAISGMSIDEKASFIDEEFRRIEALSMVSGVLRTEAYNNGKPDEYLRKQYKAEFAEFYDVYMAGSYLKYTENLTDEYRFLQKIKAECDTVAGYDEFLTSIAAKAKQLSGISIFAESKDGYDIKNIDATAKAYEDMRDTKIDYVPQMGIFTALDFALTDVVGVFAMLLIAAVLVRQERDNGLIALIRANKAGRLSTAFAKLAALGASLLAVLMLLYGVNLLYCGGVYGLGDLSRSIQSLPLLMRSTLKLSVGQYLGLFLLTKWAAAFICGAWVMLAMLYAKRLFTGGLLALSFLGANLFIRSIVPATSKLNIIKYANLVSLLRTNELIGGYRNLYFFGSPVPLVLVESIAAVLFGTMFILLFCLVFSKAQLSQGSKFAFKFPRISVAASFVGLPFLHLHKTKKPPRTTLLRIEVRKLFIMNGAVALLLLFVGFGVYEGIRTESYIDANEIYYRRYMQGVEGAVTKDKIEWLNKENEKFLPIYTLQAQMSAGKITGEQYQIMMSAYGALQQDMNNFMRVTGKLPYLREHKNAQFVYETPYLKLFDTADRKDATDALLASLLCALCFSGLFAMEHQSGMAKVLCATPLGREKTVKTKLIAVNIACGVLSFASVLPRFWTVLRDYGISAFTAPIYSMQEFSAMPEIPLFFMLFLFIFARYIAVRALAGTALALSQRLHNMLASMFVSAATFCLPLLLSVSGAVAAKWLSVYPLFHITAMFQNPSTAIAAAMYLAMLGALIYITNYYLTESFGKI
ncbi:MAG: hypothetical protein RR848_05980 [Oscillospiraceae bacterium]